jgi:hypothetical protein
MTVPKLTCDGPSFYGNEVTLARTVIDTQVLPAHRARLSSVGADVIGVMQIEDPRDWNYPFSEAFYSDPAVVYHGTSSSYRGAIEREGLVAGSPRFPVQAVLDLVAVCDSLPFRSWSYTTVKGLSRGTDLSRRDERRVYLSANFWYARDYAINTGGETIHNALRLADELLEPSRSGSELGELTERVTAIRCQLIGLTAGSFPVVYALRVDTEWLEHKGKELERMVIGDLVVTEVNISCRCSIPSERLLAKAEYTRGAETGYLGSQPGTWLEAIRIAGGPSR